jgi:hypothetical protein
MRALLEDIGKSIHLKWIKNHMDYPHQDCCLIWPYTTKRAGYPAFGKNGKTYSVHRFMCELAHGAPPDDYVAAHSCNRGFDGCVNPHHLSWKTIAENQMDRPDGKGKRTRSKLTREIAAEIRATAGKEPADVTAAKYKIGVSTVRQIRLGQMWREGSRRRAADLTSEQAVAILRLKGKKRQIEIASEFGVGIGVVARIHAGKAYAYAISTYREL